jgi:ribA/ribD-fused uncharacterized protein
VVVPSAEGLTVAKSGHVIDCFQDEYGNHLFLSNFYRHGWTVEHHYQAAKTDDPQWAARILGARTPGAAKRLGRQCPMRREWEAEKDTVMLALLRLKFSDEKLAKQLLATGDTELVEGNTWGDRYWGVCDGKGKNMLGNLLMEVRETLSYE